MYKSAARSSWSNAYLFKTIGVSTEQQARNRRDIETLLNSNLNEVIDGFIPWKEISKAYFRARENAPTVKEEVKEEVRQPTPKPVTFGENEVVEFETEDEDSEEEERPKLTLGEDIKLDEFEDDKLSVNTEDELEAKAKASETVSLNL